LDDRVAVESVLEKLAAQKIPITAAQVIPARAAKMIAGEACRFDSRARARL
jgi:hypothetical protein